MIVKGINLSSINFMLLFTLFTHFVDPINRIRAGLISSSVFGCGESSAHFDYVHPPDTPRLPQSPDQSDLAGNRCHWGRAAVA